MKAKETYLKLLEEAEDNLKKTKSEIRLVIFARVISFVLTGLVIYLFIDTPWIATITGFIGTGIFVFFIKKSGSLNRKKKFYNELISINKKELKALSAER